MYRTLLVFVLCAIAVRSTQGAILIDFDTYPDGSPVANNTPITNQYSALGIVFTGGNERALIEPGQVVSTPNYLMSPSPPQLIAAEFSVPVLRVDMVLVSVGFAGAIATAYDASGGILQTVSVHNPELGTAYARHDPISLVTTGAPIHRFEVRQISNSVVDLYGIDDLSFEAVPEPGSLVVWCALGAVVVPFRYTRRMRSRRRM